MGRQRRSTPPVRRGTISQVTSRPAAAQHVSDIARLRRGDLSVTEVCSAVGCSSLGTFSSRSTELVGVPPSGYRRRAAGATAGMRRTIVEVVGHSDRDDAERDGLRAVRPLSSPEVKRLGLVRRTEVLRNG